VSSVLLLNQELDCTLWQGAIAEAGAIEALVELAFKWPSGGEGVLVSFSTEFGTIFRFIRRMMLCLHSCPRVRGGFL
jgi:hypothetical protein